MKSMKTYVISKKGYEVNKFCSNTKKKQIHSQKEPLEEITY